MVRRLSAEEAVLWRRVVETVRPLEGVAMPAIEDEAAAVEPRPATTPAPRPRPPARSAPGTTLDASWDRRLARGRAAPDRVVDLHGHSLATAYDGLDRSLAAAIAAGERLLLLVTGKPPRAGGRPPVRGAIRAAVGDWLAASRHAADIAAVRNAHPRHGGAGALYIVLRRPKVRQKSAQEQKSFT